MPEAGEEKEEEEEEEGSADEAGAPSFRVLCGRVGDAGTTRGPGSRDSNPLPKARRFSASFSLTFSVPVFSAVLSTAASDVVIN